MATRKRSARASAAASDSDYHDDDDSGDSDDSTSRTKPRAPTRTILKVKRTKVVKKEEADHSSGHHQHQPIKSAAADSKHQNELYCICQTAYDADRAMIACDSCDMWYHLDCLRLSAFDAETSTTYECPSCRKKRLTIAPIDSRIEADFIRLMPAAVSSNRACDQCHRRFTGEWTESCHYCHRNGVVLCPSCSTLMECYICRVVSCGQCRVTTSQSLTPLLQTTKLPSTPTIRTAHRWLRCSADLTCNAVICDACSNGSCNSGNTSSANDSVCNDTASAATTAAPTVTTSGNQCSYCNAFICSSRLHDNGLVRCDILHCQQRACSSCMRASTNGSSTLSLTHISTSTVCRCRQCQIRLCHLHFNNHVAQCR